MYVLDLTQKIRNYKEKNLGNLNRDAHAFLDNIVDDIEQLGKEAVRWHIDDFERVALMIEKDKKIIYNRDKFQYALERMIDAHNAEMGICWETVDYFLNEYCLL